MECNYERFLFQSEPSYSINPFHFEVQPPCPYDESAQYLVFIHLEALWKWKSSGDPFDVFLHSMRKFGYELAEGSRKRIGQLLKMRIHRLKTELAKIRNKAYQEKYLQRWMEITLYRTEILHRPVHAIQTIHDELRLTREKLDSICCLLYEEMARAEEMERRVKLLERDSGMEHHGKPFHQVGDRQQKRQLQQVR